ncbi:hypothetical protein R1sor_023026 [Riccia sorocarpa]|uniref:DUF4283 domain-containing protein n=1 Tax=Riccia sorocarpa TaxID=122646 RepID=A0ABD3GLH5_9MARC
MVFPLPSDTRFSTKDFKSRAVPVWLELSDVHPRLMTFGLKMLRKIGPIIYAPKNIETQRIIIIRGCGVPARSRETDAQETEMVRRTRGQTNNGTHGTHQGRTTGVEARDEVEGGGAPAEQQANVEDFRMVVKPTINVLDFGVKGDGHAVWAHLETEACKMGVVRVYAPQIQKKGIELWEWLKKDNQRGKLDHSRRYEHV